MTNAKGLWLLLSQPLGCLSRILVVRVGIEPTFSSHVWRRDAVSQYAQWESQESNLIHDLQDRMRHPQQTSADAMGVEPTTFSVTGRRATICSLHPFLTVGDEGLEPPVASL